MRLLASERPCTWAMRSLRSAAAGSASVRRPSERSENPTSGRLRASASTTVATALASVDVDYDNGAGLHGAARYGRDDERAAHRLDAIKGTEYGLPRSGNIQQGECLCTVPTSSARISASSCFLGTALPFRNRGMQDGAC